MTYRIKIDDLTSNDLDTLYARLARAERAVRRAEGSEAYVAKLYVRHSQRVHGLTVDRDQWRRRAEQAETERNALRDQLDALRTGEEPGWDYRVMPTPGQWIARWNSVTPEHRLDMAAQIIDFSPRAYRCFVENHEARLVDARGAERALAEVRGVIADMEATTGARTWASWLRAAIERGLGEQPGPAATEATEPETTPGDIVLQRERGKGITVLQAPQQASMALDCLTCGSYLRVHDGVIEIADQVAYRVTGYDPDAQTLNLELAEDWRPSATKEKPMPATPCTATIEGPHVLGDGPVICTREADHPGNHVGPVHDGDGKSLWTDHTAGATPHKEI
ncbi:hypothetical protein [Streptomyces sp. NPDC016845]|uniref:hypothetical protein n=1 Tax=Streptomyces sp. NPDC016845 TaxID=3364972 RepID=UPI0037BD4CEC